MTPHYCCQGMRGLEEESDPTYPSPDTLDLMSYQPFEMGWIENLVQNAYAAVYPNLIKHRQGYPTPEDLLGRIYRGNYEFEGDVRYDTAGSRRIADCILDAREDPLYLQSWGGVNTIVRALLSIYEQYRDTKDWENIWDKVVKKVRILGVFGGYGQDNSFLDQKIPERFPGIQCLRTPYHYASFLTVHLAQEDARPLFGADFMASHIKTGHGPLLARYGLYGDGAIYQGESHRCQLGIRPVIDWPIPGFQPHHFKKFDFLGEGDSDTYIPLLACFGLRGLEDYRYGTVLGPILVDDCWPSKPGEMPGPGEKAGYNPFLRAYQEDFAARAEWCVKDYDEANHNPEVTVPQRDIEAAPGEAVPLSVRVEDPRPCHEKWWWYREGSSYEGAAQDVEQEGLTLDFTVPVDAAEGDFFNLILTVQNETENPMTSYAQVIIRVREK